MFGLEFGAVSTSISDEMRRILYDDLQELRSMYCINCDIDDLIMCIDKEFGLMANDPKRHASEFHWWNVSFIRMYICFPVIRALGGTRQDLSVKGVPAI